MKKKLILFIVLTIITFLYTWFILEIMCDEIWIYGFGYNIYSRLIPYKDFNMVVGPLYPYIVSFFIKIFGHHLYSIEILNAIIISMITIISYSKIGKNAFLLFFPLLCYSYPHYNNFCLLLTLLIVYINESNKIKYKDLFIGLLIGCIFITKQSIGICFSIVMIICMKNKLKKIIGFIIPCIIMCIYLIYNSAFFEYIDYCYLGMLDFGEKNTNLFYLIPYLVLISYLVYQIYKSRFKDETALFILAYSSVCIPIFDTTHFILFIIAFLYYIIDKYKDKAIKNYKYLFVISLSFLVFTLISEPKHNYQIYRDKSSFLYGKAVYGGKSNYQEFNITMKEYINKIKSNYENIYFFLDDKAYLIKLDINYPITKYDLINNGNLGYNGEKKYIRSLDNICKKESCIFFIGNNKNTLISQTNKNIIDYAKIRNNKIDKIEILSKNKKKLNNSINILVYDNKK